MTEILLMFLAGFYVFLSIVSFFISIVIDWKGFCIQFDKDERIMAIIAIVIFGPVITVAVLVIDLAKSILNRTVWRDNTKKVVEETVSSSLLKALNNYNKYFEKK